MVILCACRISILSGIRNANNDAIGFPELKKGMEEFRDRHYKTAFYEIAEHDGFKSTFEWVILYFSCMSLNHSLTLKQLQILQFSHMHFRHFALSPARGEIRNFLNVKLGLVLSSGATRGANGKQTEQEKAWEILDLKMAAAGNQ